MTEERTRMFVDGLIAGVLGYVAVAAFFVIVNLATGHPSLYTVALLGESVFTGVRDASAITRDPGLVLAFNGVQLAALILFGLFAAWLVYETELHRGFWYLAFFLFLAATVVGYAAVLVVTVLTGGLISAWLVVGSALIGAAAVATYLLLAHRPLVRAIQESGSARDDLG
jgi:hypothetical protein